MIGIALAVLLSTALPASADVKLFVLSDPVGATVYYSTTGVGDPTTYAGMAGSGVYLKFKTPRRWKECVRSGPVKVRWVSGAEATLDTVEMCPAVGKNQQIMFVRPALPGVEIDAQYAGALLAAERASAPPPEAPPPTTYQPLRMPRYCTSRLSGNRVVTTCTGG